MIERFTCVPVRELSGEMAGGGVAVTPEEPSNCLFRMTCASADATRITMILIGGVPGTCGIEFQYKYSIMYMKNIRLASK